MGFVYLVVVSQRFAGTSHSSSGLVCSGCYNKVLHSDQLKPEVSGP